MIFSIIFSSSTGIDLLNSMGESESNNDSYLSFSHSKPKLRKKSIFLRYTNFYSTIKYDQKFKDDDLFFLFSISENLNSNIDYSISFFLENSKVEPLNEYSQYYNDNFNGISGDIQKSYISYKKNNFAFKLGRDYFLPGKFLKDRLLFSSNGDPYDQFTFTFFKNNISMSSFYLKLNSFQCNNICQDRHINGHRLNITYKNGYFALTETSIYGGENQSIELPLLNPLNSSYVYQMNNNFNLNSIISFEYLLKNDRYYFFTEIILDDIQIEKEDSKDLEPNELGILLDFRKSFNEYFQFNSTFVAISNRTFNAPINQYEKMIYKNFPIGHILGNNFWKIENNIIFKYENYFLSAGYTYVEKGEEALFSDFNTDFLDYEINQGYHEQFPFGDKAFMSGYILEFHYTRYNNINLKSIMSYWTDTFLENEGLNLAFSIDYKYEF